jgi:hypothetical protein
VRPTAILCANDRLAIGVVLAGYRLGLNVPQDVSVMGYDDELRVTRTMFPALTTMALPLREMGAAAMTALLAEVEVAPHKTDDGGNATDAGAASPSAEATVPCRRWSGIPPGLFRPGVNSRPGCVSPDYVSPGCVSPDRRALTRTGGQARGYDNAVMENFFGHLKEELFHRVRFLNADALAPAIEEYIHWYNTKRISTKLEGLSPVQYRAQALAA